MQRLVTLVDQLRCAYFFSAVFVVNIILTSRVLLLKRHLALIIIGEAKGHIICGIGELSERVGPVVLLTAP